MHQNTIASVTAGDIMATCTSAITLKNIEFGYVRARVLGFARCSRINVEWKLKGTNQNLGNLRFIVDRGESPEQLSPISPLLTGTKEAREFIDHTAQMLNLEKKYYYRIRAVEYDPTITTVLQEFISDVFTWSGRLDPTALYIIEEHLFEHEHVNGVPVAIFQKMKEGERCQSCWDSVLKRTTKSNCKECHGTGFTGGGYYEPVYGWMKFEPDPKQVQIADFGEKEIRRSQIQFTNKPELSNGDVIVELKPGRFWRAGTVTFTEKNRVVVLQTVGLEEINRSDVEYNLVENIDNDTRSAMISQLEGRMITPEF